MNNVLPLKKLVSENVIILFLAVTGLVSSYCLYPYAVNYPYQFGYQMRGLFVPPFLTAVYLFYAFYTKQIKPAVLLKAMLLYFLQLIPFYPLFFLETAPYPGEDLARLTIYAKNMIAERTLWGGDELLFPVNSKSFITQPGYRYFVAFELVVFQKLYRFVSILNLAAMLSGIYMYYKILMQSSIKNSKVKMLLALIALLSIPYATKNVLMGLSEWFTVLILLLSIYFYLVKKWVSAAMFLLALVVFFRQNLLPPVLLIAVIIFINNENKWRNGLVFMGVLMLPLYHNLYYQHEWRFFISMFTYPFLRYSDNSLPAVGVNYLQLGNNLMHYVGLHFKRDGSIDIIEESFLCLWFFLYSLFYVVRKYFTSLTRLVLMFIVCSVLLPTIILATDFYPRFEFVVVFFFLVAVPFVDYTFKNLNVQLSNILSHIKTIR